MLSLQRFFTIPFADREISDDELRAFTEDHISRLSAANDAGQFTARLTATTAAFTGFAGQVSDQDLTNALRKAATFEMERRLGEFKEFMKTKGVGMNTILFRAGADSALYREFYPSGATEYRKANLTQAPVLMDRVVNLVTGANAANGTLLGAEFVAKAQELRTNFLQARNVQVNLKGEGSIEILDREAARRALELELFDNLLALAMLHKGEPEAAARYFNESLLKDPQPSTPPVASGSDMFPLHKKLQGG